MSILLEISVQLRHFDYENQEAQIHYNQPDQLFSITDLQVYRGLWTCVYKSLSFPQVLLLS